MSVARTRAFTLFAISPEGPGNTFVEMSVARTRAFTPITVVPDLNNILVEMSVARTRAFTRVCELIPVIARN